MDHGPTRFSAMKLVLPEPTVFSYSELQDLRQCPFKHQLRWMERWESSTESDSQRRGHLWHEMMATFYGARMEGQGWASAYRTARERHVLPERGTALSEDQDILDWMLTGYVKRWREDRMEWEILAVEATWEIPAWLHYRLKVRVDLIIRLRSDPHKHLWLVDEKTGRNLPSERELQLDAQFALYVWGLRKRGIRIWGSLHDAVRTQRNLDQDKQTLESRHARTLIHHNQNQLNTIAQDAWEDIHGAYPLVTSRVKGLVQKDRSRHLDPERCRWRCPFTEPCIAGLRGGNTRQFLRDTGFVQNPERH